MSKRNQRTSIEDISPVGEELSGEHLRLVYGGMGVFGFIKQTHYPTSNVANSWTNDSDTSNPKYDSLYSLAF